jgi:diacylglycerol kinase family enzyme/membrane-associated phospholipid phosphatase
MPGLSRFASHGLLWIVAGAVLWSTGNRQARRAAWRGLGSMAAASAVANLAGKGITSRRRPRLQVPPARRLPTPASSSFPSGHAANAAAFATGAAIEMPVLAGPAIALAAAVGASRVATGLHYPSDVLAGTAIGATAAVATLRWWPRRPPRPAVAVRPPRRAPAAPAGEGVFLLVNTSAGTASHRLAGWLAAELPQATVVEMDAGQDIRAEMRRGAAQARILGVAGGDGTVSAASAIALEAGVPLLVIPAGTFNHFAADLGVRSAPEAVAALRAGEAVLVDVGIVDRQPFINTSSTGVYADLVRVREQLEGRLGRQLAEVIGLIRVLRRGQPHELMLDGRRRRLWLYFAGNCRYEPAGMAPVYRPSLSDGRLDVRIVDARRLARSRLVASVATGTVGRSRVYHAWQASSVEIQPVDGRPVWLSRDGEVAEAGSGFTQGKYRAGLLVYRPVRQRVTR